MMRALLLIAALSLGDASMHIRHLQDAGSGSGDAGSGSGDIDGGGGSGDTEPTRAPVGIAPTTPTTEPEPSAPSNPVVVASPPPSPPVVASPPPSPFAPLPAGVEVVEVVVEKISFELAIAGSVSDFEEGSDAFTNLETALKTSTGCESPCILELTIAAAATGRRLKAEYAVKRSLQSGVTVTVDMLIPVPAAGAPAATITADSVMAATTTLISGGSAGITQALTDAGATVTVTADPAPPVQVQVAILVRSDSAIAVAGGVGTAPSPPAAASGSSAGLIIGIIGGVLCAVGIAAGAYMYMKKKQTPKVAVAS